MTQRVLNTSFGSSELALGAGAAGAAGAVGAAGAWGGGGAAGSDFEQPSAARQTTPAAIQVMRIVISETSTVFAFGFALESGRARLQPRAGRLTKHADNGKSASCPRSIDSRSV